MTRVAIIGSRDYDNFDAVQRYVRSLPEGTELVLAGADPGVPNLVANAAYAAAKDKGFTCHSYHCRIDLFGSKASYMRGKLMVEESHRLVAFSTGSEGTWMVCSYAAKCGREVIILP